MGLVSEMRATRNKNNDTLVRQLRETRQKAQTMKYEPTATYSTRPVSTQTDTGISALDALKQKKNMTQQDIAAASMQMQGVQPEPETKPFLLGNNEKTGGYLANRFEQGLTSAAYGMQKTQQLINPNMRPKNPYEAQTQKALEDKRYQARTQTAQAGQSKSKLVQRLGNVAEGIGQQIPNIMLNYASGGAAQFMTAFSAASQAIGNSYEAAKREGSSDEQAMKYAIAIGLLEGATEVISGGVPGMKGVSDPIIDGVTKGVKNRFLKVIAKQGLNALGEGVEEMITQSLDPFIKQATYDQNAKFSTKDVLNAGFDGFLTSVFMMGAPTAIELRQTGQINQQAQQMANLYTIDNQAIAGEIIAKGTQQGEAYKMLQEKPVSEMTTDEQVAFIEQVQEELGIKEVNQHPIEANGSGVTFTDNQAKDFIPVEPSKIVPEQSTETDENVSAQNKPMSVQRSYAEELDELIREQQKPETETKIGQAEPKPSGTRQGNGFLTEAEINALLSGSLGTETIVKPPEKTKPASMQKEKQQIINEANAAAKKQYLNDPNFTNWGQNKTMSNIYNGIRYTIEQLSEGNFPGDYRNTKYIGTITRISDGKSYQTKESTYWDTVESDMYNYAKEHNLFLNADANAKLKALKTYATPEPSKIDSEASTAVNKNIPVPDVKTDGGQAQQPQPTKISVQNSWVNSLPKYTKDENGNIVPAEQPQQVNTQVESKLALPDTEPELSALVSKMEEQQKQGISINLQLFGDAKKKLSQFRTNTIERSIQLTGAKTIIETAETFDPGLLEYTVETRDLWKDDAETNVKYTYDKTKQRIEDSDSINSGTMAYEASMITHIIENKARETGDWTEFLSWIQKVASKTRESARALVATRFAYDPKTMSGAVLQMQKTAQKVADDIKQNNPSIENKMKSDTEQVKNVVKRSQKQATEQMANEAENLSPEELLAKRIAAHMKEESETEIDPIKEMVNELYRVAQESPLPDKSALSKRDPLDFVVQAIKNRDQYAEVFDKAKGIVQEKFKDNPEALELLDAYFAKEAVPVFSQVKFNQAIKNEIANLDRTIADIAKSGKRKKMDIFKAVAERMMVAGNLTQDEANYLVPFLVDSYDLLVKEKAAAMLENMLKDPKKSDKTTAMQKIREVINLGEADTDALNRVLSEKYGLPVMDAKTIQEISDLYEIVDNADIKGLKESIIKESKLEGTELKLLKRLMDKTNFGIERYRSLALAQIAKRFSDKQKVTLARKISTFQYIAHLFGIKSPARNQLSNATLKTLEKVSETIAHPFARKVTEAGLKYSKEAKQAGKEARQTELLDILLGTDTRKVDKGKYNIHTQGTFKNKALSTLEKATTVALSDAYYMETRYTETLNKLMRLEGVDKPTPEIIRQAEEEMNYATLRDNSLPAQLLQSLNAALGVIGVGKVTYKSVKILGKERSLPVREFSAADLIIKYAKVPGNIIARTVEYSPAGYVKALYQFAVSKFTSDKSNITKRNIALSFGRATTGTGLMAIAYALSALGLLVQREPDEGRAEGALSSAQGLNQTQINLSALGRIVTGEGTKIKDGDTLVSISFLEPFATLLSGGASIQQALKKEMPADEAISLTATNAIEELLDMPTTAIIQAIYQEASKEEATVGTVMFVPLLKAAPGFVPAPIRDLAKVIDPTARTTSDSNIFRRGQKEVMRNIPLLSKLLEPQVTPTGKEKKQFGDDAGTRLLNSLLNPGYTTEYKNIPYADLLKKIEKKYPDYDTVYPRYYAFSELQLDDKKGNEKLTDEEKTLYMKVSGSYIDKEYTNLLRGKKIGNIDIDTVNRLLKIKSEARELAREAIKNRRKKKK